MNTLGKRIVVTVGWVEKYGEKFIDSYIQKYAMDLGKQEGWDSVGISYHPHRSSGPILQNWRLYMPDACEVIFSQGGRGNMGVALVLQTS